MELSEVSVTGKVMTIKVRDSHMRRMTSVDLGRADTLAVSLELDRQSPGRVTVGLRSGGRLSDPVMLGIFEGEEDMRRADTFYDSISEAMEKATRRSAAAKSPARAFAVGAASCVIVFLAVSAGLGFASTKSSATSAAATVTAAHAPAAVAQVAPSAPPPEVFKASQPYAPPIQTAAQVPEAAPQFIEMPRGTVVEADQVLPDDGGDPPR